MKTPKISVWLAVISSASLLNFSQSVRAASHTVEFGNNNANVFVPATLTVNVGDTVVFTHVAGFHTVTGTGADTFCGNDAIPTSCSVTFNTAGTFPYRCIFHSSGGPNPSGMVGSVTVQDAPVEKPNVTPFRINGWSDRLVVSRTSGNRISDPDFFEDQDIFVSWAIANISKTTGIQGQFFTEVLLDGVSDPSRSWSHGGLAADTFNTIEDFNLGKLPAGEHKLKLVADHTGVVDESDETDNSYEVNVRVLKRPGNFHIVEYGTGGANVFTPNNITINVGDMINFLHASGSHTITGTTAAEPFCGDNAIPAACTITFNTVGTFPYRCIFHSTGGANPAGMVGSVTVVMPTADKPNLVPFHLNDWGDSLVVSHTKGKRTSDTQLFDNQEIFVNWAIANTSLTTEIIPQFFTEVVIDGASDSAPSWTHNGLATNTFNTIEDFSLGKLAAGEHKLKLITDHTGVVDESDETDNSYELTVQVTHQSTAVEHTVEFGNGNANVFVPATLTVNVGDTVVFKHVAGFHTVTGTGADPFCGNDAIPTTCTVKFNTPGTFPYRCIFHSSGGPNPAGMIGSVTVLSPISLETAQKVEGPYSATPEAVINSTDHTVTVPAPAGPAFWRLRADTALRITKVEVVNATIVLTYQ